MSVTDLFRIDEILQMATLSSKVTLAQKKAECELEAAQVGLEAQRVGLSAAKAAVNRLQNREEDLKYLDKVIESSTSYQAVSRAKKIKEAMDESVLSSLEQKYNID